MSFTTITYRQRYWHTRKDGIRQRYWHTVTRKIPIKPPEEWWTCSLSEKTRDAIGRTTDIDMTVTTKGTKEQALEKLKDLAEKEGYKKEWWIEDTLVLNKLEITAKYGKPDHKIEEAKAISSRRKRERENNAQIRL